MALSAQCRVYVAFSDGPLVASPTWTEVTAYVRSVRTSRGRSNELDDFQAGTATIVLDNRTRRFDPDYSAGPYFGNILPRRQVKVEGVYSGVTYPIFRGVTTSWVQGYPALGRDATTTLQCADLFSLLATWELPQDAHAAAIEPLAPTLWWSLGDDTTAKDNAGSYNARYGQGRRAAAALNPGGDGASRIDVGANEAVTIAARNLSFGTSGVYTVSFYVQANSDCQLVEFFQTNVLAGNQRADIDIDGGRIRFYQGGGAGANETATATGTVPVADGNVHHIACVRNGNTITIYVDGVSDGTATSVNPMLTMDPRYVTIGYKDTPGWLVMDEFAVFYGTALTATQIGVLAAARTGWAAESVGSRISRFTDLLGVPAGLVSSQTSSSSVGAYVDASDALSAMILAARSDQGRLFVSRSGVLTFEAKTDDMGAASAATFADDSTANAVRYSGFGLELDERLIYNLVTVTGVDDASHTSRNGTSQTTYSKRSYSVQTALPSSNACRDVADLLTTRYATPSTRGRSWTVAPERTLIGSSTLAWATVLGRELGDIVTIKRTPATGSAITKTVQITAIEHDVVLPAGRWEVTFSGAPAYTAGSFRWGTSNWGGTDGWS
jgi:hypothetical protein